MKTKWIVLTALIIVVTLITLNAVSKKPSEVQPLTPQAYDDLKKSIFIEGAQLSTVTLISGDNHRFSGTLVNNGKSQVIITTAHSFKSARPNTVYEYILDGKKYSIASVCSYPKPRSGIGKDIAFCFPGKSSVIKHYWNEPTDFAGRIMVDKHGPFPVMLLSESKKLLISGVVYMENEDHPTYVIDHACKDGDSGSGFFGRDVFFVLRGNVKEGVSSIKETLGVTNVTFVTEL